jgi:hypothetical protein
MPRSRNSSSELPHTVFVCFDEVFPLTRCHSGVLGERSRSRSRERRNDRDRDRKLTAIGMQRFPALFMADCSVQAAPRETSAGILVAGDRTISKVSTHGLLVLQPSSFLLQTAAVALFLVKPGATKQEIALLRVDVTIWIPGIPTSGSMT